MKESRRWQRTSSTPSSASSRRRAPRDFDALGAARVRLPVRARRSLPALVRADGRRRPPRCATGASVPWVPASALKSVALHAAPAVVTFRSSGTTAGERRSAHHHPFPRPLSARDRPLVSRLLPAAPRPGPPMLSLVPGFEPARESSLSFMVDHVLATFAADGSASVVGPDGIDHDRARAWLAARERDRAPVPPPRHRARARSAPARARALGPALAPGPGKRALSHRRIQDAPRRAHARRPAGAARRTGSGSRAPRWSRSTA